MNYLQEEASFGQAIMHHSSQTHQKVIEENVFLNFGFEQNEHEFDIPGNLLCSEFPQSFFSPSSADNFIDATQQDTSTTPCNYHAPLVQKSLPVSSRKQLDYNKFAGPDGVDFVPASKAASKTGKKRIRWTKDLHDQFVMVVNRLGGPQHAKPKAILEMMNLDHALNILQVKSHLQKHRTARHVQKAFQERSKEKHQTDGVTELQLKIREQIEESRRLQLEVQRSVEEQLETERHLLLLIEQQKKLFPVIDHQKLE